MRTFSRILFLVSLVGFASLAIIHIAALMGFTEPFSTAIAWLGPALFVIWIPTIFVMNWLVRDFKQKDLWRAALRGCPAWMRGSLWVIFGHSWLGFFIFPLVFGGGTSSAANGARIGSAVFMIFYLVSTMVSYSAINAAHCDSLIRCTNGHTVQPLANFCDECGAPVIREPIRRGVVG